MGLRLCGFGSTFINNGHTREDEGSGKDFGSSEGIHAQGNAYNAGNDGLEVVVHAHQCGADALLADGDEEVGHKGGKEDEVGHFPPHLGRDGGKVGVDESFDGEWQDDEEGKEEHPFHERDHIVALDDGAAHSQVEGKAEGVEDGEADAEGRTVLNATGMGGLENQPYHSGKAEDDAAGFLEGDGFFEEYGRHKHGHDGGDGVDHREIDRRGHAHSIEEGHLRHDEADESGTKHGQEVASRHFDLGGEEAQQPEQNPGTYGSEGKEHLGREQTLVGNIFAEYDIETKDGVGSETGQMADEGRGLH